MHTRLCKIKENKILLIHSHLSAHSIIHFSTLLPQICISSLICTAQWLIYNLAENKNNKISKVKFTKGLQRKASILATLKEMRVLSNK